MISATPPPPPLPPAARSLVGRVINGRWQVDSQWSPPPGGSGGANSVCYYVTDTSNKKKAFLPMVVAIVLALLFLVPVVHGEDWTTSDGKTYKDITVIKHDAGSVTILDSNGGATIPLANLPPNLQKRFDYDAKAATAWKAQQDAERAAELKAEQDAAALKAQREAKAAADLKAQQDAQATAEAAKKKALSEQEQEKDALNKKAKADFDAMDKINVTGQVFITTKAGDAVKLSSIHVYLFSEDQVRAAIEQLSLKASQEMKKLQPILDEQKANYIKCATIAEHSGVDTYDDYKKQEKDAERQYSDTLFHYYDYMSQEYYTAGLPKPLSDAVSDPDGKFIISIPKAGSWVLEAEGQRSVGNNVEGYFWLTKINKDSIAKNQILLNNENLSTSHSPDSMVSAMDKYTEVIAVINESFTIKQNAEANRNKSDN